MSGTLSNAVQASFIRGIVKGLIPSVCYNFNTHPPLHKAHTKFTNKSSNNKTIEKYSKVQELQQYGKQAKAWGKKKLQTRA